VIGLAADGGEEVGDLVSVNIDAMNIQSVNEREED